MIVGINALLGAWLHQRAGHVRLRAALLFGAAGVAAAFGGARLSRLLPGPVLLVLFALLMVMIAIVMLRSQARASQPSSPWCHAGGACCLAAWW